MKVWLVILLAILLGVSAGGVMAWSEFGGVDEYFAPMSRAPTDAINAVRGAESGPRAVLVGEPKYEFGVMAYGSSSSHAFTLRNEGDAPLTIEFDHESCGLCIQVDTEYRSVTIPPGQSGQLVVGFGAKKPGTNFSESAYYRTNDRLLPTLRLDIAGVVTQALRLIPSEAPLGTVSASEGTATTLRLLGYRAEPYEILGFKYNNPATESYFEIKTSPMTPEEAQAEDKNATCGKLLELTVKPGLPLGPISQTISVEARSEGDHKLELPITGEVVGDITIIGKDYSATAGAVTLGVVPRDAGRKSTLYLLVKGPGREQVKMTVSSVDPADVLQATLEEGTPVGDGKAMKYALHLEVVKGAPLVNRFGTEQGKAAKVVIDTTHPTTRQIPIRIRFATE